ncbi:hypothetical protein O181_021952 [Austropuccinia psidii MF-1]|uniref:Protein BCP1 n=1 Tax=Austropuccinia psidii MF-1 TaxID=1389203 RepID=A0A9Q3CGI5_9BASI|nr:hypothetical protein [Austropuccinia psidii MF-1]
MTEPDSRKRKSEGELKNEGSDTDMVDETIDVTFEFCDLSPIDYHALKHLISQLFRLASPQVCTLPPTSNQRIVPPSKAPLQAVLDNIDVGELADLLLGPQKEWVGCSVKCGEDDSDPYAFASVIDLRANQEKPSVAALTSYLLSTLTASGSASSQSLELHAILTESLKPQGKGVGLVLSERLINMPVQVIPPLLTQFGNEIKHAQSQKAPGFDFTWLLIPSRVFLMRCDEDQTEEINPTFCPALSDSKQKSKKTKKSTSNQIGELGLYHPEDELISQFASHTVHFPLPKLEKTDTSKNSEEFGIEQQGRLMLIELSQWDSDHHSRNTYFVIASEVLDIYFIFKMMYFLIAGMN